MSAGHVCIMWDIRPGNNEQALIWGCRGMAAWEDGGSFQRMTVDVFCCVCIQLSCGVVTSLSRAPHNGVGFNKEDGIYVFVNAALFLILFIFRSHCRVLF